MIEQFLEAAVSRGPWSLDTIAGGGDEAKLLARSASGQEFFVKVGGMTQPRVSQVASELGLAPPFVTGGALEDGRTILVQQFVPGEPADAAWLCAHQAQVAATLHRLSTSDALRAELAPVGGGGTRARALLRLQVLEAWHAEIADAAWPGLARSRAVLDRLADLARSLPADGPPLVPVHADPQPANWRIATDGRLYLTDWETARLDEDVTDPARAAAWCLPFARRPAFISQCGLYPYATRVRAVAHWQTAQYFAAIAVWVVKRNRLARGDYFLDVAETLLSQGVWPSA